MSGIVLPAEYGYVGAAITAAGWLSFWQAGKVISARKLAKVDYPQLYAEKAEAQASKEAHTFNCTQRAHQNTLENLTNVVAATAFTGIQYPKIAAGVCAIWVIGRVMYTIGYSSGQPKDRSTGALVSLFALVGLLSGSFCTAIQLIMADV